MKKKHQIKCIYEKKSITVLVAQDMKSFQSAVHKHFKELSNFRWQFQYSDGQDNISVEEQSEYVQFLKSLKGTAITQINIFKCKDQFETGLKKSASHLSSFKKEQNSESKTVDTSMKVTNLYNQDQSANIEQKQDQRHLNDHEEDSNDPSQKYASQTHSEEASQNVHVYPNQLQSLIDKVERIDGRVDQMQQRIAEMEKQKNPDHRSDSRGVNCNGCGSNFDKKEINVYLHSVCFCHSCNSKYLVSQKL